MKNIHPSLNIFGNIVRVLAAIPRGSDMFINLIADSSVAGAPVGFVAAIQKAAAIIDASIAGNFTINISYGWGSYNNVANSSLTGVNGAIGGSNALYSVDLGTVKGWLGSSAKSVDDLTALASLNASSLSNSTAVLVASDQEKAMGVFSGDPNASDGSIGFGTATTAADWVGIAVHEITHAMGRTSQDTLPAPTILDLFRYNAPNSYQWAENAPAYFSLNGGVTDLANYSTVSDDGDLNGDSLSATDPFVAIANASTAQTMTTLDKRFMDSIGYTRATWNDFSGDGVADVILQSGGTIVDWTCAGGVATNGHALGSGLTGWTIAGSGDFNANGTSDLLLQNGASIVDWIFSNGVVTGGASMGLATGFTVVGVGDFNGDGYSDVLLQSGGTIVDWIVQNGVAVSGHQLGAGLTGWSVVGVGDFNYDGTSDILLQNGSSVVVWDMNGGTVASGVGVGLSGGFSVVGTGDFDGDGTTDILLQSGGTIVDWMVRNNVAVAGNLLGAGLSGWTVTATGDYNGDGISDIALQNGSTIVDWVMNGGKVSSGLLLGSSSGFIMKA